MSFVLRVRLSLAGSVAAALLSVGLLPHSTSAQTEPMVAPQPGNVQPLQNQTPPPGAIPAGALSRPTSIHDTYGNYEGGFPATEVRVAVDANAHAASRNAWNTVAALGRSLTLRFDRCSFDFEKSKEMTDAVNAEQQAYQGLPDRPR